MAEWLNAPILKIGVPTASGVRIPSRPPLLAANPNGEGGGLQIRFNPVRIRERSPLLASSTVEQPTVNRQVPGSSPGRAAISRRSSMAERPADNGEVSGSSPDAGTNFRVSVIDLRYHTCVFDGTVKRSPMKYHGGKWKIAPWIISHFPPHRVYVEPYGGSAAVLLRKKPSFYEVYNDTFADVVQFFEVLRNRPDDLARAIELTPYSRDEYDASYDYTDDPLERARRFAVRCGQGYASKGSIKHAGFNLGGPHGNRTPQYSAWAGMPDIVIPVAKRLKEVIIENRPAIDVILRHDSPHTLFYVDPPYLPDACRQPADYYGNSMTYEEHEELINVLDSAKAMVVISSYPNELYDSLGWERKYKSTQATTGQLADEYLYINQAAADALRS